MQEIRPLLGLSTISFLTYVAAIGTAAVRALRRESDGLLTCLLAWSGIFGLGAGSYYVGHSIPEALANLFPIWAFTLVLLTLVVVRRIARSDAHRPTLPELACLFAFGLLACSLAQTPKPWTQVARIERHGHPILSRPPEYRFIAAHVRRGEPVLLLSELGHRIADELAVKDVMPYSGLDVIQTLEQLDEALRALRCAHGHKLFLARERERSPLAALGLPPVLMGAGLRLAAQQDKAAFQMWVLP